MIWQPGKTLQGDRYKITQVLGAGRLSVTYLAEVLKGERQGEWAVIKASKDDAMQRSDFDKLQQIFVREAFKLAKCRHRHIVQAEEPLQEMVSGVFQWSTLQAQHWISTIGVFFQSLKL